MIDHIILLSFSETTTEETLKEVTRRFKALGEKIEGIVDIQAGINFAEKSREEVQVVLSVRFQSEEALTAYQTHPDHVAVAAFIRDSGRLSSTVVDINVDMV